MKMYHRIRGFFVCLSRHEIATWLVSLRARLVSTSDSDSKSLTQVIPTSVETEERTLYIVTVTHEDLILHSVVSYAESGDTPTCNTLTEGLYSVSLY